MITRSASKRTEREKEQDKITCTKFDLMWNYETE